MLAVKDIIGVLEYAIKDENTILTEWEINKLKSMIEDGSIANEIESTDLTLDEVLDEDFLEVIKDEGFIFDLTEDGFTVFHSIPVYRNEEDKYKVLGEDEDYSSIAPDIIAIAENHDYILFLSLDITSDLSKFTIYEKPLV